MAFDISSIIKDVPESGTGREQIEYIKLDLIDEDPNNFYQLSGIEELAANIELCGLQQPIRVRPVPGETERYMIVSGHRRRKAVEILAKENPEQWSEVPCIVEGDTVSPALQQLRLIYANSNTRTMTPAEVSEQAVQVEKLLYQLKEEGYDFPGRMRDHVAVAVGASKSKLARLKVIREKLAHCWESIYKQNIIAESTAYALAQLPKEWQEIIYGVHKENPQYVYQNTVENEAARIGGIADLKCTHRYDNVCENVTAMMIKNAKEGYSCCTGCCFECDSLRTCKSSCLMASARKKELKDTEKEANRAAAERQAERDRPGAEFAKLVYQRVGLARKRCGASVQTLYEAQKKIYISSIDDPRQKALEAGEGKFAPNTYLPFGYSLQAASVMTMCAVADALQCSVDYLLGRSEVPEVARVENVSNSGTGWHTGNPEAYGTYVAYVRITGVAKSLLRELLWDGEEWFLNGEKISDVDVTVKYWAEQPEL